jgi:hypothetical protein
MDCAGRRADGEAQIFFNRSNRCVVNLTIKPLASSKSIR